MDELGVALTKMSFAIIAVICLLGVIEFLQIIYFKQIDTSLVSLYKERIISNCLPSQFHLLSLPSRKAYP
jgi:hypothetical protein